LWHMDIIARLGYALCVLRNPLDPL
jgi:hypothetical protein